MKLYQFFTLLLLRLYGKPTAFNYPAVHRDESYVDVYHGTKVPDPYHWLEQVDSPETKAFVEAQNAVTEPYLKSCPERDKIQKGLENLMKYTKTGVPTVKGGRYFYKESEGLQNQEILYVQDGLHGLKRVLVDPNKLSTDGSTSLAGYAPSKDGQLLAYGLRQKGSDWFTIHFLDVNSGKHFPDTLANTKFSRMDWTHDHKGIFYTRYPDFENMKEGDGLETAADQNSKIYYHLVGTPQTEDVLVTEFPEHPNWGCFTSISDDGKYLLVFVEQELGPNQIHYIELDKWINDGRKPLPMLYSVVDNFESEYSYVTNTENIFIFKTNRKASNNRLVGINIYNPKEPNWDNNVVQEDGNKVLDSATAVNGDQLLLLYKENVRDVVQLRNLNDGTILWTWTPDIGTIWGYYGHRDSPEFFFNFVSTLSPGTIYRIDLGDRNYSMGPRLETYRKAEIPSFRAADYVMKQIFYESKDGTKVPMFISHKKDIQLGPTTPALLYGYGGYNIIVDPYFSAENAMLIKNFNGVFASACIRGGGEYGETWHNDGRLMKKQNSFDDFHAAAEYLIAENFTSAAKLTIKGTSNGGLLVAACLNQRPDLYGAGTVRVGVTDMLKYHKFTTGAAWTSEYGSADNETMFPHLMSYSPLHNVRMPADNETQYPATLVMTGDHDDRVVPSHSFKLIAELQHTIGLDERQTNPLLLRTEVNVGHGAGRPTYKMVEEATDVFSFLCKALGLKFVEDPPEPDEDDYYE